MMLIELMIDVDGTRQKECLRKTWTVDEMKSLSLSQEDAWVWYEWRRKVRRLVVRAACAHVQVYTTFQYTV